MDRLESLLHKKSFLDKKINDLLKTNNKQEDTNIVNNDIKRQSAGNSIDIHTAIKDSFSRMNIQDKFIK